MIFDHIMIISGQHGTAAGKRQGHPGAGHRQLSGLQSLIRTEYHCNVNHFVVQDPFSTNPELEQGSESFFEDLGSMDPFVRPLQAAARGFLERRRLFLALQHYSDNIDRVVRAQGGGEK